MIITEYWPLDVFMSGLLPTCEIWCRSDIACIISVKLVIPFPADGAMIIMEYLP